MMTLREGGIKAREAGQHVKKVVRITLNAATGGFMFCACFVPNANGAVAGGREISFERPASHPTPQDIDIGSKSKQPKQSRVE